MSTRVLNLAASRAVNAARGVALVRVAAVSLGGAAGASRALLVLGNSVARGLVQTLDGRAANVRTSRVHTKNFALGADGAVASCGALLHAAARGQLRVGGRVAASANVHGACVCAVEVRLDGRVFGQGKVGLDGLNLLGLGVL